LFEDALSPFLALFFHPFLVAGLKIIRKHKTHALLRFFFTHPSLASPVSWEQNKSYFVLLYMDHNIGGGGSFSKDKRKKKIETSFRIPRHLLEHAQRPGISHISGRNTQYSHSFPIPVIPTASATPLFY
jgi:hypothetical protein